MRNIVFCFVLIAIQTGWHESLAADLRVLPKAPQSSRLPATSPKDRPKAVECTADGTGSMSCTVEPGLLEIGKGKLK